MRKTSLTSFVVVVFVMTVVVGACTQPTPEERVAKLRARYEAILNGFLVEQQPIEVAEPIDEGQEVEEDGSQEAEEEPVALRQSVLVDVVIRHESSEKLDGITVDITMADGDRELQTWRAWFDTSSIEKGPGAQFSHTMENVDYQPGYGFSAEIRYPVPPEERPLYREFSDLGG